MLHEKNKVRRSLGLRLRLVAVVLPLAAVAGIGIFAAFSANPAQPLWQHADTWISQPHSFDESASQFRHSSGGQLAASSPAVPKSLGLAAGGAQDADNFRENIENGFLPLHTDITYEGLFYDYYFDTRYTQECAKVFCPSYSYAVSKDPLSGVEEYYLSVGLNSGIDASEFERSTLNLVLVLDVSGSMGSPFDRYHYDMLGLADPDDDFASSKISLAKDAMVSLLGHLEPEDRLGMVLFNGEAHLARPLGELGKTDMEVLAEHIREIRADGGTDISVGMRMAASLFDGMAATEDLERENRVILLTDAMPNTGETTGEGLLGMIKLNAGRGIYTTVIGIGVDFNTELVEQITKVPGANYYSVHSSSDFHERIVDEFEFMVTPLVFDLALGMEAEGYEIKGIYGSPEADPSSGQVMRIGTLFPSEAEDGRVRGGIVLLEMERTSENGTITLTASYRDRAGVQDGATVTVSMGDGGADQYQGPGVQKGVLLVRYAELMKEWAYEERRALAVGGEPTTSRLYGEGAGTPGREYEPLGRWERESVPLAVSGQYADAIRQFSEYFREQAGEIGDPELLREVSLLERLASL